MSNSVNYGISGAGSITAQNIAVGKNSTIISTGSNIIDQSNHAELLSGPLADLQQAIEAFQGLAATRDELLSAHAEIAQELKAPEPDKNKLLSKLTSITQLAGPATAIVQAAAVLMQAIIPIL
jgi:hypothetical protein